MNKIDILEVGIPNLCFSLAGELENKKRREKLKKQRIKRGFDDSETWSLYTVFASFMIPRLKRFQKLNNGYPNGMTFETFNEKIDIVIETFEIIINLDKYEMELMNNHETYEYEMKKIHEKIKDGLKIFSEIFMDLWW